MQCRMLASIVPTALSLHPLALAEHYSPLPLAPAAHPAQPQVQCPAAAGTLQPPLIAPKWAAVAALAGWGLPVAAGCSTLDLGGDAGSTCGREEICNCLSRQPKAQPSRQLHRGCFTADTCKTLQAEWTEGDLIAPPLGKPLVIQNRTTHLCHPAALPATF